MKTKKERSNVWIKVITYETILFTNTIRQENKEEKKNRACAYTRKYWALAAPVL